MRRSESDASELTLPVLVAIMVQNDGYVLVWRLYTLQTPGPNKATKETRGERVRHRL